MARPTWLDLVLLIVGLVAGVLLGPAVLGKVAPEMHLAWFQGGVAEQKVVDDYLAERASLRQKVPGVEGDSVLDVFDRETAAQQRMYESELFIAQAKFANVYRSRMTAIILAVAGLMLLEVFMVTGASNMVDAVRFSSKVATARYALVAVWLAMLLAVPAQLRELPMVFTILVLIVAAAVALAPLRKTAAKQES